MNLTGRFALIAKRKFKDAKLASDLIKVIVEHHEFVGDESSYRRNEYEFQSGIGKEVKLYPKRKLVDLEGLANLNILFQHIVSLIPSPVGILKRSVSMAIPWPSVSVATAEDHSGGAHTATPSLTVAIPTVTGVAATTYVVVEDCEDAWNESVGGNVTSTADTGDYQKGSASAKLDVAAAAGVGYLATEAITSANLTAYNYLRAWVKSTVNLDAGDLDILLDDTASCASPLEEIDIPSLTANTWTEITVAITNPAALTAVISIGIDMNVDKGAFIFRIDQVRATEGGA